MEIISLLLLPIAFISFIWLLVVGFKISIPWGFGLLVAPLAIILFSVLLIEPTSIASISLVAVVAFIPAIFFAYKNWEEAHKAFITYFVSSFLSILLSINSLSNMGNNELETLITQVQQQQIEEQDAAPRMRAYIESIEDSSSLSEQEKLVIQTAKTIISQVESNLEKDPDYYNKSINQEYEKDLAKLEAQRKKEASLQKLQQRLSQRNEKEKVTEPTQPITLPEIKKDEVKKYLGAKVIVESTKNIKHRGILKSFDDESYSLIIEQEHKSGKLNFKIHMSDIKIIYLNVNAL